ncbi:protein FAM173B [Cephus cinctus]|uniref:Protein FAM173B n=1 Tax=Cephus cinctus TaxID=211228 RepID=A0AAJ7BYT5_CEPCN|nr:protein FAM173B [Cephus cinctus]
MHSLLKPSLLFLLLPSPMKKCVSYYGGTKMSVFHAFVTENIMRYCITYDWDTFIKMESSFLQTDQKSDVTKNSSKVGLILVGITGGVAVALSVICIPFVSPALRRICLPYVPATTQQVDNVLHALKSQSGSSIDLGSGDGRIVFALAKAGFRADGIELNPWLVLYSRFQAVSQGISSKTSFYRKDLWKFNVNKYDNVVIFGVEQMMNDVEEKFIRELRSNCTIVACRFPLPNVKPLNTIGHGVDTVWVYKTPLMLSR